MAETKSSKDGETERRSLDTVFTSLADEERRRIVAMVSDRAPDPVPRDELATALAARTNGDRPDDVTDEERERVASRLHHTHLPALAWAGLVEYDPDDVTVALSDHPALEDPGIVEVVEGEVPADPGSLDALLRALADARRRTVLDVLSHQIGRIHVETLARELEARAENTRESDVPAEDADRVLGALVHGDLPCLADAELVEFDPDEGTVAYEGHPQLRVPWMHSVLQPEFRRSLTGESDPSGVGELEGREEVISFGQSLFDRADEELFCMYTDTGLLEAGCLACIRDAARRGVDVYLGTPNEDVREYVQENAPEVLVWEPNTNWLNLPAAGERVGRLLLADREAAMLGTLRERQVDGVDDEQAIIGEGEHDTLVTMICQLLGPHLEEIDEDTEDIEARLPV
jgi:DNA-binding transcriptional ArsR family regulator